MRTRPSTVVVWILAVVLGSFCFRAALAQEAESPQAAAEIQIEPHWSPYQAPSSYPEGTQLHIIVKGDTLWDLANQYLSNPYLWPQLWEANRYITDPHWIYPGDPVTLPEVDVVRAQEGEPGAPGAEAVPGAPGEPAAPGAPGAPGVAGLPGQIGPGLYPAYEEIAIQCAGYISDSEDESIRIIGSEEGAAKIGLTQRDIVYINKGTSDGVQPGNQYYTQRHVTGFTSSHIERSGWVTILASQEKTATAEITQACLEVLVNDYLIPFEPIPVPLIPSQKAAGLLTPETGQLRGQVLASLDDIRSLGEGYLVSIDLGEQDGVIPGNLFVIFRYMRSDVQRRVMGELAVLTVQEKTSTAKITESYDYIVIGDLVELK